MPDQVTRNNHYVPQWYQRGFFESGQSQLYYLDMSPPQEVLPDGRTISMHAVHKWGPKKCFCDYDLYSTHFGALVNDEIERLFFGAIDNRGAKAVRALVDADGTALHERFQDLFEYLDAQKLRTPKGLGWIKSRYSSLDQLQLMQEMQALRCMHYVMWTEGVREIVSAENSDVKFIVSDHPVTIYNAAVSPSSPSSPDCAYPDDPPVEWLGSQTVFVLDANTCLILTHLEYAQEQDVAGLGNLTQPRTHARHQGQSIARADAFIRTRKVSREEVVTINYLLKSRARRYLAASNKGWLYPEKLFDGQWQDIASVLRPRDELWRFGGEMYVGYADGSTQYQDPFGRTSGAHEYLRRDKHAADLGSNALCGCGSGRKFKHCCKHLPLADRPTWEVYGIRERNLMFCHAVQDILGLNAGKTWDDVRRELSEEHVKRIHNAFASLWPPNTDLSELLPRRQKTVFRAVYLGVSDPRTVQAMVIGWLAYFDEVILAHPFINPLCVKPEFSPTKSPSQLKAQTLKNVLLLLSLEPFIQAGHVHLIPDPGDFNLQFGMSALQMAKQRIAGWEPDLKSTGCMQTLAEDDHKRLLSRLPDGALSRLIHEQMPNAADTKIETVIAHMKSELAADPLALLQPMESGEAGAQLICFKGYSLESAMYLASLTGSVIYTDVQAHWQQLHGYALQADRAPNSVWSSVVDGMRAISFPITMNPQTLYKALQTGRFGTMRAVWRRFLDSVRQSSDGTQPEQIALQFTNAHHTVQSEWARLPDTLVLKGQVDVSVPAGGFERHEVRRLLLTFGRAKSVRPIPFAIFVKTSV